MLRILILVMYVLSVQSSSAYIPSQPSHNGTDDFVCGLTHDADFTYVHASTGEEVYVLAETWTYVNHRHIIDLTDLNERTLYIVEVDDPQDVEWKWFLTGPEDDELRIIVGEYDIPTICAFEKRVREGEMFLIPDT